MSDHTGTSGKDMGAEVAGVALSAMTGGILALIAFATVGGERPRARRLSFRDCARAHPE